jgi:hypothetical protein
MTCILMTMSSVDVSYLHLTLSLFLYIYPMQTVLLYSIQNKVGISSFLVYSTSTNAKIKRSSSSSSNSDSR